jgi:hypothetical protein
VQPSEEETADETSGIVFYFTINYYLHFPIRQQLLFRSHHPNHWFPLQRTTRTVSQLNLQVTRSPNDDPPDYSQIATTSFINNNDDNDNTTIADNNDTELLLNEPPPYVP